MIRPVFVDCESALFVEEIRVLLRERGVTLHHFAPGTGHLANPDDSNFHAGDRSRINHSFATFGHARALTGDEKMEIMIGAYQGATELEIKGYFRHCGFFTDEKPEEISSRLIQDWKRKSSSRYEAYHRDQLEQYLYYRLSKGKAIKDLPGRIGPWWDTIREFAAKSGKDD